MMLVQHPEHAPVMVNAANKLQAVKKASKKWCRRWTEVARDCTVAPVTIDG